MDQDQCRGVEVQSAPYNFTRIDRDMIDGADAKALVRNQPVLAVEIEDVEPLDLATNCEGVMPMSA